MKGIESLGKKLRHNMEHPLNHLFRDYIADVRRTMIIMDVAATRNLLQSFTPLVSITDKGQITLKLQMDYYWKYVHYGVNGTKRRNTKYNWRALGLVDRRHRWSDAIDAIERWKKFRGLPRRVSPYAILQKVKRDGLKPRPFLVKPTDRFAKQTQRVFFRHVEKFIESNLWL